MDRHKNRIAHNRKNLIGSKFGKLLVIDISDIKKGKRVCWKCKCECGNLKVINSKYLLSGDTNSCGCLKKEPSYNRDLIDLISLSTWGHIKSQAKSRSIPFEIDREYASSLLRKQNFLCALSDEPIQLVINYRDEYKNITASLDRIDSSKGYIEGNVQWVHKVVNIMKNKISQLNFIEWCNKIVKTNLSKPSIGHGLEVVHTPKEDNMKVEI